jgi:hypothetical protein
VRPYGPHEIKVIKAPVKEAPSIHVPQIAELDFDVDPFPGGGAGAHIQNAGFVADDFGGKRLVFEYFHRHDGVLPFPAQDGVEKGAKLLLVPFLAHDFEENVIIEGIEPFGKHNTSKNRFSV